MLVMKDRTQSWSIIIFCYNEEGTLRSVIESVEDFLQTIHCAKSEVIIVDDGSTDNCVEIVREAAERYSNVRPVYHPRNLGIGCALRSGYAAVEYENVSAVPADGQFNVAELIPYANLPGKTMVSFYRKENTIYSLRRNLLSYANRRLNAICIGLKQRDVNWVKIYKRDELQELDLKMKSSLVESEICAKLMLRENKMIEMESVYHPRTTGRSKGASSPVVLRAALETLKLLCVVNLYRMQRRGE
jgi:glycosyltransferase involved in cell wall biosynthesis